MPRAESGRADTIRNIILVSEVYAGGIQYTTRSKKNEPPIRAKGLHPAISDDATAALLHQELKLRAIDHRLGSTPYRYSAVC